ncbi:LssY C-terminal domain-containing protein [Edaphobacter modestus]|uniref:LssY-like putative type I secretion system component LssY n=1 Tax=Edaphobacter modestus TaxID=388466 RepID=A0A4V2G4G8_9BACT|nr:LssY C-terminal domain-containing protein [Edaphobacter modestus]RZU40866.1 LssY-like putative type I secretion system component LssY [Edaphobacter modestus]
MNHSKCFQSERRWRRILWAIALVCTNIGVPLHAQTSPAAPEPKSGQSKLPDPPPLAVPPSPSDISPLAPVIAPAVGPRVEAIVSMRDNQGKNAAIASHKQNYELTLKDSEWLDTGVVVSAGELATFKSTGDIIMADAREATPDGIERGWKDLLRQFPLNQAKVGALIGRVSDIGASVPFSIGTSGEVAMPTTGTLYLRINVSSDLSFTGDYKVKIKFAPAPKAKGNAVSATLAAPISTVITPATFDDIPRRVSDVAAGHGHPGDMVNFAIVGTREQVQAAFQAAGWTAVDKSVQEAILDGLLKTLSREAYTAVPMSTLYLFGRPQDMSYSRADPLLVAAERHHLRVWQSDKTVAGRPLWVGSATHDIGFEKDQRTGGVTHKIDPEIDKERDYLLQGFDAAGAFSSAAYVTPSNPLLDARTATGGSFQSDGRILTMELR